MEQYNSTKEKIDDLQEMSFYTNRDMTIKYQMAPPPPSQTSKGESKVTAEDYRLSQDELSVLAETIYKKLTFGKNPSTRPFAVICLAQPGAGKSGLMAYSSSQFRNAIPIDIDELRAFHPKYDELGVYHPELFESVTGQFATSMVLMLTPVLIENKHSLILHKTRGDEQIIVDTIDPLKKEGYDLILRTLSVNFIDSKLSSLERSMDIRDRTGYCRWVETPYHDKHYNGVVSLTDKLQREGYADVVQVFERGPVPPKPTLIYSKLVNSNALTNPAFISSTGEYQVGDFNPANYYSAKDAIEKSRAQQLPKALDLCPERVETIKKKAIQGGREYEFIAELEGFYKAYD